MRSPSSTSWSSYLQLRRRVSRCCALAVVVGAWAAHAQDVTIPPSILLPNYDRVYPGLNEALEGGAYIARARNAPAVFYNPAGIALTDRTVLNASAQGYQLTTLGGTGFDQSSPISSFEAIPSFLGVVLGREVIDWEAVRLGFAVVTPVHWDQSAIASTVVSPAERASYSVHSNFSTLTPTFSAGWAVSPSFRLGASIEFPYTTVSDEGKLSAEITDTTGSQGTIRTLAVNGSTLDLVGVIGLQWEALSWLQLGLVYRSPGLKINSKGSFQYEALTTLLPSGSRQAFISDPSAQFEYRSPMEVSMGVAVEFGAVQIEADIRWHDGSHTYDVLSSTQEGRLVNTSTGTPAVSSFGFAGVPYKARQIWNGSVGAHFTLSPTLSLSVGSYLDQSPADAVSKGFRRVDLLGFRTGVAFKIGKLDASVGVGWEHGTAPDDLAPSGPIPSESAELSLNTFTLLFSVGFKF